MTIIKPKRLQPGDTIGIVAPSSYVNDERASWLEKSIEVLESFDLRVKMGKHFRSKDQYGVSAGLPEERASDVNEMFADPSIKAVWCYTGGNTANQILDLLHYPTIRKNPKIFIGMSDNTVLLHAIYKETRLVTFYGGEPKFNPKGDPQNPENFASSYTQEQFKKRFMLGEIGEIDAMVGKEWKTIRGGKGISRLSGGHFQRFLKLVGTSYNPPLMADAIFLMEGYTEDIEKSIATLTQLEQIGGLNCSGIVIGHMYPFDNPTSPQFSKNVDAEGKRIYLEDLVFEATKEYETPILKAPIFGHRCPSTFLPLGTLAELDATSKSLKLLEPCVE